MTTDHETTADATIADDQGEATGTMEDAAASWRQRAEEAQSRLGEATRELEETRRELAEARGTISRAARRQEIEAALADALDIGSAALLVEATLEAGEAEDVESAVDALRRRTPMLFRAAPGPRAMAMDGRVREEGSGLAEIAQEARESGDRQALVRYLRLRRGG